MCERASAVFAVGFILFGLVAPASARAAQPTVVSITFDDGYAEDLTAASMLEARGLRGTFYVISGYLSTPAVPVSGYLSVASALELQARGHEIGGHTLTHPDLTTLDASDATRQICNDRTRLLGQGLDVRSFAYPFGVSAPALETAVAGCGYGSGRIVGPITDSDAPLAESVPPLDAYAVRTAWSVESTTKLADLEKWVTDAESVGGWLPIVFHHLCNASPCDQYSITSAHFGAFLDWLAARPPTTRVALVRDVVGGALQPAVHLAQPVLNPSLESDVAPADGLPDFWQLTSIGTNTAVWSRTTDAHTGSSAERVDVSSFTSGAVRMVPTLRTCAPPAIPGHTYRLSAWYKSSLQPQWALYYRDPTGAWTWWTQSGPLAAASGWTQATYDTPAVPADASAIGFGLSAYATGWMVLDDLAMEDRGLAPPSVALTFPVDGASVSGIVTLTAAADAFAGVAQVHFHVNGELVGSVYSAPYSLSWDTRTVADGTVALSARVHDRQGAVADSPVTSAIVTNAAGLVKNPYLESDVAPRDGVPDCWQPVFLASTTGTMAMTADAHTGSYAEVINVTSAGSGGGARLVPTLDAGACAPPGTPGKTYTVTGWYKGGAPRWVVFYRSASGAWTWWAQSTVLPASSTWSRATYTTPALPAGATHLSFGLTLYGVGTLTVDDFSLFENP